MQIASDAITSKSMQVRELSRGKGLSLVLQRGCEAMMVILYHRVSATLASHPC